MSDYMSIDLYCFRINTKPILERYTNTLKENKMTWRQYQLWLWEILPWIYEDNETAECPHSYLEPVFPPVVTRTYAGLGAAPNQQRASY